MENTRHDEIYILKRNTLIGSAVKHADNVVGKKPKGGNSNEWANAWNRAYFGEMDRLAKEAGLI